MRVVVRLVYRSIVRLQVVEAERSGLSYIHDAGRLDDLFVTISRMTHAQRLNWLGALGERTDDLALPEPPQ